MLRITMSKSAGGAKKYYSEEYYSEGQQQELNYYSEKGQVIGKWGGKGAAKLRLDEDILKEDFAALCDNKNPLTGKKLTGRNDADRTVGYDFTFNASKSVSLAYTFGGENEKKEILQAFRNAVRDTMDEVETGMQARVRGKGKNENRETGNIIYGEFVHFTTRPVDGVPDPHLHSHCFIFNATYDGQEEKWKAGQFRQLKTDAPYYQAVFHSNLARRLEDLGYKTNRTEDGFELTGIEKSTNDKFSRRTKEIEEHAKEHGITDDKQKSQIGAKTREGKRVDLDHTKQAAEWRGRLSDEEYSRIKNLKGNVSNSSANSDEAAKQAVKFSLDHHLERKSVATDKAILATAIKSSVGIATPEQIRKAFARDSNVIAVKKELQTFITTHEAVNEEKQLISDAISLKNKFRPINEKYEIKNDLLNEQQRTGVSHSLSSTDGIIIITGKAGTGKTTLMLEVKKGIEECGKRIYSFAPSSEASRGVQRSEGFENANTVASLIQNTSLHPDLKNQVIWIDEAGMLSNKDLNGVIGIAKAWNARIILSGDTRQHNSVQRGDALRILQQYAGIRSITISKIIRQKDREYREAAKLLSEGSVDKGFKKLDSIGAIKEVPDSSTRCKAIAEDYHGSAYLHGEQTKKVLVIAPTHAEGEIVTAHIRQKLRSEELIGDSDREFVTLKNLQFTEVEKQQPENYKPGNVLVFHKHAKGISAGTRLNVVAVESDRILAKNNEGMEFSVPLAQSQKFGVFDVTKTPVSKGDKIRITGNGKSIDGKHLFNGTTYDIHSFDKQGNLRLSNGSILSKDYGQFTLGYVMTSHSSQGKTADKVIISQSSATFRAASIEQFYVSVSRGKQAVSIYTDDKETLMQAVSQSVQRISATELLAHKKGINPTSTFNNTQEQARKSIEKFKTTKNQTNDISRTHRTGIQKTR